MKIKPMHRILLKLIYVIILLLQIDGNKAEIPDCDYEDTVDLSGKELSNGSYSYEGVSIPPFLIGTYDYEILLNGKRKPVAEYKRGCVCKIIQCVKFCCPLNELKVADERKCSSALNDKIDLNANITIYDQFLNKRNANALNFVFQQGQSCHLTYPRGNKGFILFMNGSIYLRNNTIVSKREYCLTTYKTGDEYILSPLICISAQPLSTKGIVYITAMLISVPFFFATIFVYLVIPKLRNLHAMCLSSYLLALAIGYILLVTNVIGMSYMELTRKTCYAVGFAEYYFFMAAFFWLNIISFDMWRNLHKVFGRYERYQGKHKRFFFYPLYAWGCPALFTIIAMVAQTLNIKEDLKPGISNDIEKDISCWLSMTGSIIYLYIPSFLIIFANIILFVMSFLKIYKTKKESEQLMSNYRHVGKQWNNFLLYLRLFVVMGVSWIFEVVLIIFDEKINEAWLYAGDVCNGLQGLIIFTLFILKPKVLLLIKERVRCSDEKGSSNLVKLREIKNTTSSN